MIGHIQSRKAGMVCVLRLRPFRRSIENALHLVSMQDVKKGIASIIEIQHQW
jgi:hypothetical protein